MRPRLFPYRTIIRRCWPGALRLPSQIASDRRGIGMPIIQGKSIFSRKLVLSWRRREDSGSEQKLWGIFLRERGTKNLLDCGAKALHNLGYG